MLPYILFLPLREGFISTSSGSGTLNFTMYLKFINVRIKKFCSKRMQNIQEMIYF